jgi:hypothetical protein
MKNILFFLILVFLGFMAFSWMAGTGLINGG